MARRSDTCSTSSRRTEPTTRCSATFPREKATRDWSSLVGRRRRIIMRSQTDIYNDWRKGTGRIQISARSRVAGLRDILPPAYPGYELRITDQLRADVFLRELAQFEQNGDLPNLIFIALPVNHTQGTSPAF